MREDFSEFRIPRSVVEAFPPDRDGLFEEFFDSVTEPMLEHIARADYGDDEEAHRAALDDLLESGLDTKDLDWYPLEVLELVRWSGKENKSGLSDHDYHLTRGFCAVTLAVIPDDNGNNTNPSEYNIAVLYEVCQELSPRFDRLYARFLTYWLESLDVWDKEYLLIALALTGHCAAREGRQWGASEDAMANWLVRVSPKMLAWHSNQCDGDVSNLGRLANGVNVQPWIGICEQLLEHYDKDDPFYQLVNDSIAGLHAQARTLKQFAITIGRTALFGFRVEIGDWLKQTGEWIQGLAGKKPES